MSVVGFDFGNESGVVAVARQRGIDVVLNDESKRETPALVCFGDKQRFLGTAGAASSMMNPKNTISQIKRLIGRQFSDPELQRDIKSLPFSVTEGPDGYPLINARYLGELRSFTPTQVLGMVLSDLKSIAEKNLNAAVVDCCIGIPIYFTDLQRRAVLDAATIAGLHPLRLIHETTATALAYGIYKTDLPENDQLNVAFVDIGHASMQVCIAGFKKGQLKILSHSFDRSLGGRDFDEVLFQHFAAKFKTEYKIDVYRNARACLRLRAGCEKLKKVISANPEAPLNIECLMDDKDVRGFIKRDEFEQISIPILERVKKPLEKALSEAGLTVESIYAVEVVGEGSSFKDIWKIRVQLMKPVTWPPLIWGVVCGAAASGNFHWNLEDVAKSVVCMMMSGPCLTGYTQTLNDWYDREIDAINEPYRPIPSGAISENEVITQIWVLLLGGLGLAGILDVWAGHKFPIIFYLALGGSLLSYIYSAPPLKLKQNGWIGNFALGASYISLPWWAGQALFGTLTPDIIVLTLLYSIAGLGIAIVNDFKSVEGDRAMGLQSLPVAFGFETAKWICVGAIDITQLSVAGYLLGAGKPYYALALLGLIAPQVFFQFKYFLKDPVKYDVKYQASAQPFLILGILVTALATSH